MTEPPRPPGEGSPGASDPTSPPQPPPASYSMPGEAPAPGYAPPPSGGYPPPQAPGSYPPPPGGGYAPPGAGPGFAPAGFANSDEKTWALIAHAGGAIGMFVGVGCGGWVAPLIAMLAKGNESQTVRAHAVAALNFQLLWSIIGIVGWATACIGIGFIVWIAAMIIGIVFGVIAAMKANEGQFYRYPMSLNLVK